MPSLTGQPIVTNYGKQQILSDSADITKIKLGSGVWTPTESSTSLNTQEASVAASGSVETNPGGGYRLHINGTDASGNSYDVHEFALTDDTDQALVIYSQAAIIDTKGAASSLLFRIDIVIEQAGTGSISISGDTTFILPDATTTVKGIVERATDAEVTTGTDTTRYVSPKHLSDRTTPRAVATGAVHSGASAGVDWGVGIDSVLVYSDYMLVLLDSGVMPDEDAASIMVTTNTGSSNDYAPATAYAYAPDQIRINAPRLVATHAAAVLTSAAISFYVTVLR